MKPITGKAGMAARIAAIAIIMAMLSLTAVTLSKENGGWGTKKTTTTTVIGKGASTSHHWLYFRLETAGDRIFEVRVSPELYKKTKEGDKLAVEFKPLPDGGGDDIRIREAS